MIIIVMMRMITKLVSTKNKQQQNCLQTHQNSQQNYLLEMSTF